MVILVKYDLATIQVINSKINENIELILDKLDVSYEVRGEHELRGPCPIHGGDNHTGFLYNKDKETWRCFTKSCHDKQFGPIGLVKSIIAKQNGKCYLPAAIEWVIKTLNLDIKESQNKDDNDVYRLVSKLKSIKFTKQDSRPRNSIDLPIEKVHISERDTYFRKQGFKDETIDKFKIGYCSDPYKPMYQRSFCLILDDDATKVVGVTGRSIFDQCQLCFYFHDPNNGCPSDGNEDVLYSKWKHYGFNPDLTMYNVWNAKTKIMESNTVILVEGPKCVWRLYEAGVENSLAILGNNVGSLAQIRKLISLNVINIVSCMDNDDAGKEFTEKMIYTMGDYFKIIDISKYQPDDKDVGKMPTEDVKQIIVPQILGATAKWQRN